jgi:predicted nucleic acid-binding protein
MSVVISNTTPINYLVLIDHIAVLCHLYGRVIIPQAVFGELQHEGTPAKVKAWVLPHAFELLVFRPPSAHTHCSCGRD